MIYNIKHYYYNILSHTYTHLDMVQAVASIQIDALRFPVHRHDRKTNIYSSMDLASDNLRMGEDTLTEKHWKQI